MSGGNRPPSRRALSKQLAKAIDDRDLARVRELEAIAPGLAARGNAHGNTPLMHAVEVGNLAMVELLVELGADVCACNDGGWSVLDGVTGRDNRAIAELLIERGAVADAWHFAAIGDTERLGAALDAEPDLHSAGRRRRNDGILHVAVRAGEVDAVRLLLGRGARVGHENVHGHAPLACVPECESREPRLVIARELLAAGADPNAAAGHYGGTVLHEAIATGDCDLVHMLLAAGADPNRQDDGGSSALHKAVARGLVGLVEGVLAFSPDLGLRTREVPHTNRPGGETALEWAVRIRKKRVAQMIRQHAES